MRGGAAILIIALALIAVRPAGAVEVNAFRAFGPPEGQRTCLDRAAPALAAALNGSLKALKVDFTHAGRVAYEVKTRFQGDQPRPVGHSAWQNLAGEVQDCDGAGAVKELAQEIVSLDAGERADMAKAIQAFLMAPEPFTTLADGEPGDGRIDFCLGDNGDRCTEQLPIAPFEGDAGDETTDIPADQGNANPDSRPADPGPGDGAEVEGSQATQPPGAGTGADDARAAEPLAPRGPTGQGLLIGILVAVLAGIVGGLIGLRYMVKRLVALNARLDALEAARLPVQDGELAILRRQGAWTARRSRWIARQLWRQYRPVADDQGRMPAADPRVPEPAPAEPPAAEPQPAAEAADLLRDYNLMVVQDADPAAFTARYQVEGWSRAQQDRQPVTRYNIYRARPGQKPDLWLVVDAEVPDAHLVLPGPGIWREVTYLHMDGGVYLAADYEFFFEVVVERDFALSRPARVRLEKGGPMTVLETGRIGVK